jgi:3-oxoadipate enol-lactonase
MFIRESGDPRAPAVLLLHGQVLDGSIYDALADRLARRLRVLVPDLPGYGRTPLLEPFSLPAVREALEAELAGRSIRATAIVGYSLGGYHAIALALAGKVAVSRLALLGPLAGADGPVRDAFRGYADAVRGGMKVGSVFAPMAIPPAYAAAHPELVARVAAAGDAVAAATYLAEFEAIAELADLRPRLGEIRAPTLVRCGVDDQNTPLPTVRQVASAIPGAVLEVVPGCGHLLLEQDAVATADSLGKFLGA